ncbi:MAG: prepilin-type N-terminal cleavage/methylation domain-containing protein [Phycisphaerales bacterium]|jgi:prepilin-type N-terminal cleavage/methylation domain-containing protein
MQAMAGTTGAQGGAMQDRRGAMSLRGGFTLIELVVVIGIIALLVSITLVVGASVAAKARGGKTRDAIRVLDASLTEYIADRGKIPPPTVLEPKSSHYDDDERRLVPVADAVFDTTHKEPGSAYPTPRLINSVGFYLLQLEDSPGASNQIKSLSDDFVQLVPTYTPTSEGDVTDGPALFHENGDHVGIPTVMDGWGRPLRYVHPRYDGQVGAAADARRKGMPGLPYIVTDILVGQDEDELAVLKLRRNKIMKEEYTDLGLSQRDGDGGLCPGDRPYFYSAGVDGDPSSTDDNVYSNQPVFTVPDFADE